MPTDFSWLACLMTEQNYRRVLRVSELARQGVGPNEIARRRRDGTFTSVRRGVVVEGPPERDARRHQLELIAATMPMLSGGDEVLTHTSAAALLGLPMTFMGSDRVWLNRPAGSSSHRRRQLVVRDGPMEPDEIAEVDGLLVTGLERTAVDMAREFGFVTGVMMADAVLRRSGSPEQLQELVRRGARRRGNATARAVAAFADELPESPGESLMRAQLELQGCPAPELQVEILDLHGFLVARCDYGWREQGVVGEYDGMEKYGRLLKPGQTVSDVVDAEKEREANIRDQGLEIIRFSRADLRSPRAAATRLNRLLSSRARSGMTVAPGIWAGPRRVATTSRSPVSVGPVWDDEAPLLPPNAS